MKRKTIGRELGEVFQVEAGKLTNTKWLAQGTIYLDVITKRGASTASLARCMSSGR